MLLRHIYMIRSVRHWHELFIGYIQIPEVFATYPFFISQYCFRRHPVGQFYNNSFILLSSICRKSLWQPSILFGSFSTQLQSSYRYWLLHSPDYYQECCLVNLIFLYCVYGYTALFLAAFFQDKLFFPPIYGLRFVYGLRIRSIQSLFQSFHRVYASQL